MYQHILIPTDGSALSSRAVSHGVAIAAAMKARLTGLFVAPAPTPLVFKGLVPVKHLQPDEHAALTAVAARRYLGRIESTAARAGVACECITLTGEYPAQAILEVAASRKCDLIVMGSRGLGTHTGALLGSVARSVVELSDVPVLLVK